MDSIPLTTHIKDVPVDAFRSFAVYTAEGYLGGNDLSINNCNEISAGPNEDQPIPIDLGACDDGRINCIPVFPD